MMSGQTFVKEEIQLDLNEIKVEDRDFAIINAHDNSSEESMAMCGVAIVMSGEVGFPWEGRRVGVSVLRSVRSRSIRVLCI